MEFTYNLPVNLIFGRGKAEQIGKICAAYGKKALIVTGRSSTKRSGLLDKAVSLLKAEQIESVVFDKVSQNPLTTTAHEGKKVLLENGCDFVLALGGGSIIDCAKAIAFLGKNEGDVNDYIYGRKAGNTALPLVAVPTTCGTGSEGNGFAVLTNPENGDKKSLKNNCIIPAASIIDPNLMKTMPKGVLASVCFDALCHLMEAYISVNSQPITEYLAPAAIKLIADNLPAVYAGNAGDEAWDALTLASTLGGMSIFVSGVTLPHGMEHPASGLHDIVHGKGLAALTPVIIEESAFAAEEKYGVISRILGGSDAYDCADAVRGLLKKVDLNVTLSQLGVSEKDVDWMTENCLKVSAASISNHPAKFGAQGIRRIYEKAL